MNVHSAREHREAFREAVGLAEGLPGDQRLGAINEAWRRYGLPVQEALSDDPFGLSKVFGQLLQAYGRATSEAQRAKEAA